MIYRNTRWYKRDYECSNVVACVADHKMPEQWVEADESFLAGLSKLWTENNVTYYGYL